MTVTDKTSNERDYAMLFGIHRSVRYHQMLLSSDNLSYEVYTARKGDYEIIGSVVAVIKVME